MVHLQIHQHQIVLRTGEHAGRISIHHCRTGVRYSLRPHKLKSLSDLRPQIHVFYPGCPQQSGSHCPRAAAIPVHTTETGAGRPARHRRDPSDPVPAPRQRAVSIVPAEQLIPAVSTQRYRHVLPRHSAHQISRDLRGIRKRFPEHARQMRDHIPGLLLRNIQLRVIRSQIRRDLLRHIGLIELLIPHADRKALHLPLTQGLHQSHHRAAVDSRG